MRMGSAVVGRRLVMLAVACAWIFCSAAVGVAQDSSAAADRAAPVKVMSFNIRYGAANDGENRWAKRSYLVAETITLFDPDLLGGQEVLKFQAQFLKQLLPEFGFHGVGREDGTEKGEFVPLLYRKSRFDLVDAGHFWLSETPEVAGSKSWDSSLPRMASWVKLSDKQDAGKQLVFINTHFDHRGKQARLESAKLIRERADQFVADGLPVIITGDFNTTEDLTPYEALTGAGADGADGFVDSYRAAHPVRQSDEASSSRWTGHRDGSRIDWVLHSPDFVTLQSSINYTNEEGRYPSDHYPVQAVLRLNR